MARFNRRVDWRVSIRLQTVLDGSHKPVALEQADYARTVTACHPAVAIRKAMDELVRDPELKQRRIQHFTASVCEARE